MSSDDRRPLSTQLAALSTAVALGAAVAALIEWWQTYAVFGHLPFPVTIESVNVLHAWLHAMMVAPLAAMASALLLATRSDKWAAPALVATMILAARVWENVSGYLAPPSSDANIEGTPLTATFYDPSPYVFIAVTLLALAVAAFVLWRTRPRVATLFIGALASLILIILGGHLGFAPVAFLRLRNWTFVVALLDVVAVVRWRRPRAEDLVAWALLLVVIGCAVVNATAWQTMRLSFPRDLTIPAW